MTITKIGCCALGSENSSLESISSYWAGQSISHRHLADPATVILKKLDGIVEERTVELKEEEGIGTES